MCFLLRPPLIFATAGVDICCFHTCANMGCKQKRRRAATWDDGEQQPGTTAMRPVVVVRGETYATSVSGEGRELQPATTCGTNSSTNQASSAHHGRFFELAGDVLRARRQRGRRGHPGTREGALAGELLLELSRSPPPWIRDGATQGERKSFLFLAVAWGSDSDLTGLNCCIGWLVADRPKISVDAPAPSSRQW